ncbi:hypothetical protein, partial [Streptomyces xanthochromogenes]
MTILAAAYAAHTTTDPADQNQGQGQIAHTFTAIWDALAAVVPGGGLTLMGAVLLAGYAADQSSKKKKATGSEKADQAIAAAARSLFGGLWQILRFVLRFVGGRELRGEPKSDATTFRPGKPTAPPAGLQIEMGSVALPVSLVKPRRPRRRAPAPWALAVA